jgi:hypothetical protein
MAHTKIHFPCGFEIDQEASWYLNDEDIVKLYHYGCPLHGKKCK